MPEENKILEDGLRQLNIRYTSRQLDQCILYIENIIEFNSHTNIIGTGEKKEITIRHILDCLTGLKYFLLYKNIKIADLGSGAGLPGIPLSIFDPDNFYFCIESKKKKCNFLENIKNRLLLKNLIIINNNILELKETFDIITARAYAVIKKIVKDAKFLIHKNSTFILYKGTRIKIEAELAESSIYGQYDIINIQVPFLAEERHLVIIKNLRINK
ncbi:MAG: 16S rRNA (guanine(527)-N(7))-methyltransferase RsmG [Spirochaetes bacterium GWF1_41_5]|nr:MAG: 16S rRNA (guanine(527)-N(7))-methyltransferase RsmG [Spirochaetes bacterium GWF1_41_5]